MKFYKNKSLKKTESERTMNIDQLNSVEERDFRLMKGKQIFRLHTQNFLIVSPCQPDRKKKVILLHKMST